MIGILIFLTIGFLHRSFLRQDRIADEFQQHRAVIKALYGYPPIGLVPIDVPDIRFDIGQK